ncbi:hypothetical protein LIT13_15295, partial [Flavobacterium psychrophilum]
VGSGYALQSFLSAKSLKKRISAAIPHAAQHISIQNFDPSYFQKQTNPFFLIYQIRVICVANHKPQMQ